MTHPHLRTSHTPIYPVLGLPTTSLSLHLSCASQQSSPSHRSQVHIYLCLFNMVQGMSQMGVTTAKARAAGKEGEQWDRVERDRVERDREGSHVEPVMKLWTLHNAP
eukprot:GHVU01172458.1.p4 GENE.GHVU01172458.1~~GHVU01172458.1.p4  ORF type:complete len:107 (-),score=10.18 GHVU01172458.1:1878-2198(-)